MHLDFVEGHNWLDCATRAALFEFENPEYVQVLQICMDIGHIPVNEAGGLTHALRLVVRNCFDEFKAEWRETVGEIIVGSELEDGTLVALY